MRNELNHLFQIHFDIVLKSNEEVYEYISEIIGHNSIYKEEIKKKLFKREESGNIMIFEQVILPHVESDIFKESQVIFIKLKNPVYKWNENLDDIRLIICVLLKQNEKQKVKQEIILLMRNLAKESFIKSLLKSNNTKEFNNIINNWRNQS